MRVLVACEFSGVVRDAFAARGHDAWSCDLLPTESPGNHVEGDVSDQPEGWLESFDLLIAHPPCTHLSVSGARWFKEKKQEQADALDFVRWFMAAPVPRIAIENPVSVISSKVRKPEQIIQPYQFGHQESKAVCLWLTRLPPLVHTGLESVREHRVHKLPPGPDRWKERSRFFPGIAEAMARQWGDRFSKEQA